MKMSSATDVQDNVPDLSDRIVNRIVSPRLNSRNNIINYFENKEEIRNKGATSSIKEPKNVILWSINPRSYIPNNECKMRMLKKAIKRFELDIILMNEVSTKWNTCNLGRI